MTDPRSLFRRAVPPADHVDMAAVRDRAARLSRRRRAAVIVGGLSTAAVLVSGAVVLVDTGPDVLLPPASSPSPSSFPSPPTSPSSSPSVPATPGSPGSPSPTQGATMTVQVFFSSMSSSTFRCEEVEPVQRRVPETSGVADAALTALFQGPTDAEQADGLSSVFGSQTAGMLRSVRIADGVAYVDLDATLEGVNNVSTSCLSTALLSQMQATLLQFPTVRQAVFAIDGDPLRFYGLLERGCPDVLADGERCDASGF